MAKSLRSKWRRKCRAVKRVRYGEKELERLKKTLGIDDTKNEVDMEQVTDIATVVDSKKLKEDAKSAKAKTDDASTMDTDEKKRNFNPKTLKDESGTYPVWMTQRKIKAVKKASKKSAKITKNKTRKGKR